MIARMLNAFKKSEPMFRPDPETVEGLKQELGDFRRGLVEWVGKWADAASRSSQLEAERDDLKEQLAEAKLCYETEVGYHTETCQEKNRAEQFLDELLDAWNTLLNVGWWDAQQDTWKLDVKDVQPMLATANKIREALSGAEATGGESKYISAIGPEQQAGAPPSESVGPAPESVCPDEGPFCTDVPRPASRDCADPDCPLHSRVSEIPPDHHRDAYSSRASARLTEAEGLLAKVPRILFEQDQQARRAYSNEPFRRLHWFDLKDWQQKAWQKEADALLGGESG